MNKGKLIVIEGIDGSGKSTQINLLSQYLKDKQIPYEVISFPRYEDNIYGKLIKRYLEGEFGSIDKVNPYLISLAYAGDRSLAKPKIEEWLAEGKVVIANRYVSSSKAHMGANMPEKKRGEFLKWLDELEYETNKMPKEELTILLKVDPKLGQQNVLDRHPDLHEEDINHLSQANDIYVELSVKEPNWQVINCMEDEQMQSIEDIHQKLIKTILPRFF